MKKVLTIVLPIIAIFITVAVVLAIVFNQSEFSGNRVANPDLYSLEIDRMNGSDSHTMELNEGDCLVVHFERKKGVLNLNISAPDGKAIYNGNGENATDFVLNITQTGRYVFTVNAKHANGIISIKIKEKENE